jgi:guanosine-3',5'-bis(diphosphate) 3'-pyrophosphohydrolase
MVACSVHVCSLSCFCMTFQGIVAELTDDKNLDKAERKRLQIVNACRLTPDAIRVRLADKIYNLRDLNRVTPVGWSTTRIDEYFRWSAQIARQLFGHNTAMDTILKELFQQRNISFD